MKIYREGMEIELTKEELLSAYLEQEHLYDVGNILDNMDGYLSIRNCERFRDDADFIENAANKLREKEDMGMSYDDALSAAFKEAKQEYFEKNRDHIKGKALYDFLDELLKDAAGIEYKGIIFDDWCVDSEFDNIWAEICEDCAKEHMDQIEGELDDAGAIGTCSVLGCNVSGKDTANEHHYYIDFDLDFIKPLSKKQLLAAEANLPKKRKLSLDEKMEQAAKQTGETSPSSIQNPDLSRF